MAPQADPREVRRAAAGDSEAQSSLWRTHRRFAAAVLLAHRPPGAEIEDLLQDVALAFVRGIGALREPERFRPWLRTIALNAARMNARRSGARALDSAAERSRGALTLVPLVAADDPATDDRDEALRALRLVEQLDPKYREPLVLRCLRGMSQAEIAAALDLPETPSETRLARARRWLRDAARDDGAPRNDHHACADEAAAPGATWNRRASTS